MRWRLCLALLLCCASLLRAQEQQNPEELKKMYDDALAQLKAAQDRKNELGSENEKLQARIAELEKQLVERDARIGQLELAAATHADNTFFLRSHYASWRSFLNLHPQLKARWELFLESELLAAPADLPEFIDSDWPLSAKG